MENLDTKYETGVWYGWNGGECPVHPKTYVEVQWPRNTITLATIADHMSWGDTFLFYIITPYVPIADATEPAPKLECWVNVYEGGLGSFNFTTKAEADAGAKGLDDRIRCVRMVEADE